MHSCDHRSLTTEGSGFTLSQRLITFVQGDRIFHDWLFDYDEKEDAIIAMFRQRRALIATCSLKSHLLEKSRPRNTDLSFCPNVRPPASHSCPIQKTILRAKICCMFQIIARTGRNMLAHQIFGHLLISHRAASPPITTSAVGAISIGSVRLLALVRQSRLQLWRSMLDRLRVNNKLERVELLVFLFVLQESHFPKFL